MKFEPSTKDVLALLSRCQKVKSLTEKARQTDEMQHALQRLLPSMLADYCQIRSFQQGVLALNASTGAAATQLRFVAHQLLPKLQKLNTFNGLEKITIRVQAPESVQVKPSPVLRTRPPVSASNRDLILDTANNIHDQELAAALRQLASTLSKNGRK